MRVPDLRRPAVHVRLDDAVVVVQHTNRRPAGCDKACRCPVAAADGGHGTDPHTEVADDDVVGEGCFGVVFKGAFRGEDVPIKMNDADATRWRSSSGRSTCLTSSGASRPSAPTARLHPKQRHDGDGVCTMRVACRCHLETHEQLETPRPISLGLHAGCCRCDGEEPGHKRCMRDWQPRRRRHVFRRTTRLVPFDDNADHT